MDLFFSSVLSRYILVGILNTALYGGLLFVFLQYVSLPKYIAVAVAFVFAMVFQYTASRSFIFRSAGKIKEEVPKYLTAAFLNYVLSVLVVYLLSSIGVVSAAICSAIASVAAAVSGYFLSRFWVFKRKK